MKRIIFSSFEENHELIRDLIQYVVESDILHNQKYKLQLISGKESEFLEFLLLSFRNSGEFPSLDLFTSNFPETVGSFENIPKLDIKDYKVYVYNFINRRLNKAISKEILTVNQEIENKGITDSLKDRLDTLYKLSNSNKSKEVELDINFKSFYEEKLKQPIGLIFNCPALDNIVRGMGKGTMVTVAGFTSHFKSTCGVNSAYYNTYYNGYNLAYFSFENPKEEVLTNILSRHSYESKFSEYDFIGHEKIRNMELSEEEKNYLYDVVYPDYLENSKGKLVILDETDFRTLSYGEILSTLEEVDEKLGGNLDGFFVDYVQLLKFTEGRGSGFGGDDNSIVNGYISFFRRLTQKFLSGEHEKKLIGVLLSQINRSSWSKAARNEGRYDLTCLADANELERGSHVVVTLFTTDLMKVNKEISVQVLKNRNGRTLYDPEIVYVDPEVYLFGEDVSSTGFYSPNSSLGGGDSLGDSLSDAFGDSSLDDLI